MGVAAALPQGSLLNKKQDFLRDFGEIGPVQGCGSLELGETDRGPRKDVTAAQVSPGSCSPPGPGFCSFPASSPRAIASQVFISSLCAELRAGGTSCAAGGVAQGAWNAAGGGEEAEE